MDQPDTDVIRGTLNMPILKTLTHGFGITRRIERLAGQDGCMRGWYGTGNSRRSPAIARLLKAEA